MLHISKLKCSLSPVPNGLLPMLFSKLDIVSVCPLTMLLNQPISVAYVPHSLCSWFTSSYA